MKQTRILIVDDHPLVRQGLSLNLTAQPDFEVCGEVETEHEALEMVEKMQPDLMLIDISLRSGNGIEVIKQVKNRHPKIKMLAISAFQENFYGERVLRAGASGYLNKQESQTRLLEAVRTVLRGERFVSFQLSRRLIAQALEGSGETRETTEMLSNRELEVFRMIGQGLTTGVIASKLHLSRHTIDSHRENIKRKIGARNSGELNRKAIQWFLENG
jgi:DNA-binding NarL/FixJ family response regulator